MLCFTALNLAIPCIFNDIIRGIEFGDRKKIFNRKRKNEDFPEISTVTKMQKKEENYNNIKKNVTFADFISRRNRLNTYVIKNPLRYTSLFSPSLTSSPLLAVPLFGNRKKRKKRKIEWKRPWGEMHNSKSEKGKCLPTFEKIKLMTRKLEWTAKFAIHFKTLGGLERFPFPHEQKYWS